MLAFFRTLLSLFIVFKMSDVEMGEGGSGQEPSAVTEEGAPAATEAEVGVQQAQVESASSGGAGGSALTGRGKEGEAVREKRKDPKTTFKHLSEVREKGGAEYWTWLEPVLVTELVKGKEEQVRGQEGGHARIQSAVDGGVAQRGQRSVRHAFRAH